MEALDGFARIGLRESPTMAVQSGTEPERDVTPSPMTMPALFYAADAASASARREFMVLSFVLLLGLAAAAIGGAMTWIPVGSTDIGGLVAIAGFTLALAMKVQILASRVDQAWYEGRAAAESAKTMAWRYATGGDPFAVSLEPAAAEELLSTRLLEMLTDLQHVALVHPTSSMDQITADMRGIRSLDLKDRRVTYQTLRVQDQQHWYVHKARSHERRARIWSLCMLLVLLTGAAGALLKTVGALNVDLLGVAAAAAAAIVAWEQLRQDGTLAKAYSIAAQELAAISVLVPHQVTEQAWAKFVASAEEAISREHTLWRASRT